MGSGGTETPLIRRHPLYFMNEDPWYYTKAKEFGNWYKNNPGFAALTMLLGFILGRIFH